MVKRKSDAAFFYDYFINSDFSVDLSTGEKKIHNKVDLNWKITMVDTGINTMTGGRIKRMKKIIGNDTFLLTYGDGLSNINLTKLIEFHKKHGKLVTVSAVHPGARFGEIEIDGKIVKSFTEKPQINSGWINGGFFVMEPEFFEYIYDDDSILERDPLEKAVKNGELMAYCHDDFWHCMDTIRDKESLEELWASGNPPWKII